MENNSGAGSQSLSAMKLPELKEMAAKVGLKGAYRLKKAELIEAILAAQSASKIEPETKAEPETKIDSEPKAEPEIKTEPVEPTSAKKPKKKEQLEIAIELPVREAGQGTAPETKPEAESQAPVRRTRRRAVSPQNATSAKPEIDVRAAIAEDLAHVKHSEDKAAISTEKPAARPIDNKESLGQIDLPEGGDSARRRRDRGRRRGRGREGQPINGQQNTQTQNGQSQNGHASSDQQTASNDDFVPIAGILDVQSNHAFVRTSGYLPGPNDVYVALGNVKRWSLRAGDAVAGAVRPMKEGEQQRRGQKYNALVRVDSVNGMTIEQAAARREFAKLTPEYPSQMLRLETTPKAMTPRLIDIVSPIGKGQRGMIVSPPKAGKTMVLQQIAKAIEVNNPDVHLMVVLVDERPEEVTDMRGLVRGEVVASTFDRPASDHTIVAELAIERAKRLVEMGQDVVVLLDSLTRLSRAYNLAAPASGRILSGGVDAGALYPPKKFFGAARNLREGGSLTIIASALVETGSKMDEVIFEEFKGTGNMELRLSRQLADRRIFPAIDVNASGTRREEQLLSPEELKIVWKLRRTLGNLDQQSSLELILGRLKETQSNAEFLMMVQKTTPSD